GVTHGIAQIRRHIPPLDAEIFVRAVVGGKGECPAGNYARKTVRLLFQPGKALRARLRGQRQQGRAAGKTASRDAASAHWRRSGSGRPAASAPAAARAAPPRTAPPAWQRRRAASVAAETPGTAAASRMPSRSPPRAGT